MGDPRFQRKKFKTPLHPWQASRIKEEGELVKEYGLKNKREIWKMRSKLRNWQDQAQAIVAMAGEKEEAATKVLLDKLQKFGAISPEAKFDDILSLTVRDVAERRLQTQLYKKGMAFTPKQARQFIVHKKVLVNNRQITSPSYLVKVGDDVRLAPGFAIVKAEKPAEVKA